MEELVAKAKSGDTKAFDELILIFEKDLQRIATSRLVNKDYANDIVQNTLIKAFLNLDKLKDNKKFKSWLFTILIHECINLNKKILQHKDIYLNDYDENLIDFSSSSESKINFEQMISKLSEDEKKIIRMKFEENYSNMEISEELGIPYNTVRSKINRALKKISLLVFILVILSGLTVIATFVIKQIKAHFTTSLNAIDSAVENGYVQTFDGDFVYSNGIGIKVDAIVLDDKNLDISFVYDVVDKEKYKEITGIRIKDYVIKDENKVLINSTNYINNCIKISKQYMKNYENNNSFYRNSILFSTINDFSKIQKIILKISSVHIKIDDSKNKYVNGDWNLEYDIEKRFNNRIINSYSLDHNNYIKNYIVNLTDTSIIFRITFNNELEFNDITHAVLYNKYNKFRIINYHLFNNNLSVEISFDIGKYNKNIDNLILEVPLHNNKKIILNFKRNL